ncbi:hypothetical protein E1I69_09065 [Bacillus timonensis]|uniref:Uncharacterized protein n=1 Tax=Bacillus timonensis TaxID=1033734 RepID=A0A4V3V7W5_9BACI|nr:hypothetical protein [Bacillus timonensis]THE13013.1 hypothetical protein E1I69_09065 [Bacillus timonensis]
MIIHWISLLIVICFLAFSYYKRYSLKTRLSYLGALFILSLLMTLPILGFSVFTLIGLFFIEKIWVLLAAVFFIEAAINNDGRIVRFILAVVSIVIYLFIRKFI